MSLTSFDETTIEPTNRAKRRATESEGNARRARAPKRPNGFWNDEANRREAFEWYKRVHMARIGYPAFKHVETHVCAFLTSTTMESGSNGRCLACWPPALYDGRPPARPQAACS